MKPAHSVAVTALATGAFIFLTAHSVELSTARTPGLQIDGKGAHTCSVDPVGAVECWGLNDHGQVGADPSVPYRNDPVTVQGVANAVSVSAHAVHSCAVIGDGTIRCWGSNQMGQLGDGSFEDSFRPVTVVGIDDAIAVAAGVFHTCALHSGHTVSCWGYNGYGQLGDRTYTNSAVPIRVAGVDDALTITSGGDHNCSVIKGGAIKCWGWNAQGQVGVGSYQENILDPTDVVGISNAVDVSAGDYHTCALLSDGTGACWGLNGEGPAPEPIVVPPPISVGKGVPTIISAGHFNEAIHLEWTPVEQAESYNVYYAEASGPTPATYRWYSGGAITGIAGTKATISDLRNGVRYYAVVTSVSAAGESQPSLQASAVPEARKNYAPTGVTVTRAPGGEARITWDVIGGGASYSIYASDVPPKPSTFLASPFGRAMRGVRGDAGLIAGLDDNRSMFFTATGSYLGFEYRQLGNGTRFNTNVPTPVLGLSDAAAIKAGFANSCASLTDGTLKCWGRNTQRQINDWDDVALGSATRVPGVSKVTDFAMAAPMCAAIGAVVRCWGPSRTPPGR